MSDERTPLSNSRGNKYGIGFFHILLKLLGANRACEFVWFIAFFYVLFDFRARRSAQAGIRHLFPKAGPLQRFWRTWALFTGQGQSLIEAAVMTAGKLHCTSENRELCTVLENKPEGFILLASHFGCWQSLIGGLDDVRKPVSILAEPDQNIYVDKMDSGKKLRNKITPISVYNPGGGLEEAAEVLERGEVVCIMGDRCRESRGLRIPFLGEPARFPAAAFFLAARTGCAVLPVFALPGKDHYTQRVQYGPVIYPEMSGRDRTALIPFIRCYTNVLEKNAKSFPARTFIFDDPWS